ncbi:MAG: serine/threonine protein kinase, partial [Myxococcales bacterium]|nr:serine/threonine protein kinase [Myxococcales bacterium]
ELLEGESLRERLMREGAVRPALALEWVAQCADGVQAAHDANVIHRDLKPENVFLTKKGDIRVLDFGTAKFEGFGHPATSTNDRVGTVPYMSPEHLGGEELDGRSDVYALGFILYEMLAGRHPFSDERGAFPPMDQLIGMVLGGEPDSLAHHVGEQVWQVVVRAIAKDKNHRFGSMAELAQACRSAAAAYGAQGTGALRLSGSSANMPVPAGASGSYAAMSQSGLSPLGQSGMGQSGLTPSPLTSSGVRPPVTGVSGGTLAGLGALAVVLGAAIVFLASPGKPGDDGAQAAPASSDNETTLVAPPSEPTGEAKTEPSATTEAKAATSASATAASGTPTASASVSAKVVRPPPPPPPPTATPITKPPPCVRNPDEPFPLPCPK